MEIINTIIVSSCSEIIISAPRGNEIVIMTHIDATVKVKDNLLMIHHKGDKKKYSSSRLVLLPSDDTRTSYCNCCSSIDQSMNNTEDYISHHIHNEHSISCITTQGLGDVSVALSMNPISQIVSNGAGNITLVTKNRFTCLAVKLRRDGNISLGNTSVDKAELFSEGSGEIRNIHIGVSGVFKISASGDIVFKRSRQCTTDKVIKGSGRIREIL